jgi:uncharacterized protein YkwD
MIHQRFQSFTALALAFALIVTPSTFAENRSTRRTNSAQGRVATSVTNGVESILEAMNRERTARGLVPLRLNSRLSEAAQDRVGDMFSKRYFAHVSPDGINPFHWVRRRGYRYRLIGENLAVGFRGTRVVDGWMHSPGHRANILERGFNEVGIAVANGSPQRGYKGPLVVAMYGRR